MASAVNLSSTTIEGQVLELATQIQALEADTATANPSQTNNLTFTLNTDSQIASITVNLPFEFQVGASGALEATATEYLSN